ncbi:unnamed protein product [Caenorhabditis brenneri]
MAFPQYPHGYLYGNVSWTVPIGTQLRELNVVHDIVHRSIFINKTPLFGKIDMEHGRTMPFILAGKMCTMTLARDGNVFTYTLKIEDDSFEAYKEKYQKEFEMWKMNIDGTDWVVVLDKNAMEAFGNGEKLTTESVFEGNGTVISFNLGQTLCRIESEGASKIHLNCNFYKNNELVLSLLSLDDPGEKRHNAERIIKSRFLEV